MAREPENLRVEDLLHRLVLEIGSVEAVARSYTGRALVAETLVERNGKQCGRDANPFDSSLLRIPFESFDQRSADPPAMMIAANEQARQHVIAPSQYTDEFLSDFRNVEHGRSNDLSDRLPMLGRIGEGVLERPEQPVLLVRVGVREVVRSIGVGNQPADLCGVGVTAFANLHDAPFPGHAADSSQDCHRRAVAGPHGDAILRVYERQVMDMKRIPYVLVLMVVLSLSAAAGVRPHPESGTSADVGSAETGILFAVEDATDDAASAASAEGSIELLAYGEAHSVTQTASMAVSLSPSSDHVLTGETVVFDATTSSIEDDAIVSYRWDFDGDGAFDLTSSESTLEYAFADHGLTMVTVQAVSRTDATALSNAVQIHVVNRAPTADFISAGFAIERTALAFTDLSTDTDGEVVRWLWSFGDGTTSTQSNPVHTYTETGEYVVTLTVTDDDGDTSAWIAPPILVTNAAPVASFAVRQSATADGHAITLIDESNDPSSGGEIVHVAWDFGDGTYDVAGSPDGEGIYDHVYSATGTYTITLYVIDNDGTMATTTRTVHVL